MTGVQTCALPISAHSEDPGKAGLVTIEGHRIHVPPKPLAAEDGEGGRRRAAYRRRGIVLVEPPDVRVRGEASARCRPKTNGKGALEDDMRRHFLGRVTDGANRLLLRQDMLLQ